MKRTNGLPGLYVVFDGIVGCGKSAQIDELKERFEVDFPGLKAEFTFEPGGNPEANEIRKKLKFEEQSYREEMNLFVQSRAITIPQIVVPALRRGEIVFSDRCFSTSLAYQAFGRELGLREVWQANEKAVGRIYPDIIYYIKVGLEASLKRSAGNNPDKFDRESRAFWGRTVEGYEEAFKFIRTLSPETKIITIDDPEGKLSISEMNAEIRKTLYPEIFVWRQGLEGAIRRER